MDRREMLIGLGLSPILVSLFPRLSHAEDGKDDKQDKDDEGKMVDYLFVQTAAAGSLRNGELLLTRVTPATLFFSDRPKRLAGHVPTDVFVEHWGAGGSDSFEAEPPNAALSIIRKRSPQEIVVTLKNPRLKNGDLLYQVNVVEGSAYAEGETCSLFIDVIGMPLTPRSYAGMARRVARRTVRRVARRHSW